MSDSALIVHRGARHVTREELEQVHAPPSTETWFPLPHSHVLDRTLTTLEQAGFRPRRTQLALSRENCRFFGTIDLESPVADGVLLAVGVRNSIDKSYGETSVMLDRDEISERQSIFGFFKNA